MRFYYFARSTTVPQKLNGSDDDLRRILQLVGAVPCFRKRRTMEILNAYERKYSRSEMKIIKEFIERICHIEYEIYCERSKTEKSGHLHKSIDRRAS